MQPVTDEKDLCQIVALAERYLEKHQPRDYRLNVVRDSIHWEDDYYYVVVEPNREDAPSYDCNARMVEAELDLQEAEGRHIMLVPAIPG